MTDRRGGRVAIAAAAAAAAEILGPATNGRIHDSFPGAAAPPDGGWSAGLTNMTASTVTGRAYAICRR